MFEAKEENGETWPVELAAWLLTGVAGGGTPVDLTLTLTYFFATPSTKISTHRKNITQ